MAGITGWRMLQRGEEGTRHWINIYRPEKYLKTTRNKNIKRNIVWRDPEA